MRPVDAEPIEQALFKQADKSLAKNPYENARICAFRRALELILDAPTIAPPPNDPLTLEELREMPPYEWCWIDRKPKPGYYCKFRRYTTEKSFSCGWPGSDTFIFDYEDYGKDWIAYRRKPEEG